MSDDNKYHDVTIEHIQKIEEKALKRPNVIKVQKEKEMILCSFCGKLQIEVRILVQSETGVTICNECVVFCNKLLNDKDDS